MSRNTPVTKANKDKQYLRPCPWADHKYEEFEKRPVNKELWEHIGQGHKAEGTELQAEFCSFKHIRQQNQKEKESCKKNMRPVF